MLKLPAIDSNRFNKRKKFNVRPEKEAGRINIDSQIFKNGTTWYDLDKLLDLSPRNIHKPYSSKHLGCKKLYEDQCTFPEIHDYDDMKLRRSLYLEHAPQDNRFEKFKKFEKTVKTLESQWKEVEVEELQFKTLVESYDRFIRLNAEKRLTSQKKCGSFKQRNIELMAKITELRKKNNYLRNINKKLAEEIKKHIHYQNFLTETSMLEGYGSATQLVMRFLSIKETEEVLREKNNLTSAEMVAHICGLNSYHQKKLDLIEWLATKCSQQKDKFVAAKACAAKGVEVLFAIQQETLFRIRKTVEVFNGVDNCYNLVRRRHLDNKHIPIGQYDRQIAYIDTNMRCIRKINENLLKEEKKQSHMTEPSEIVYTFNIPENEDSKEKSSGLQLNDVLKSINALQKFTKHREHDSDETNLSKKKTQFAESDSESEFRNFDLERKISDTSKLMESIRRYTKYIESAFLDELRLPSWKRASEQLNELRITNTSRHKNISIEKSSGVKKERKAKRPHSKHRKSSNSSGQSSESQAITMGLSQPRRTSAAYPISRSRIPMKHLEYHKMFVNDDGTITIFSEE